MGRHLRESGSMVRKMVLEYGNHPRETIMKVSGPKTGKTDKDTSIILGDRSIEESSKIS